ncbi:helix-turn-helix domain-containing protein [Gracilimonas sp.]|uniref:winged helix-turn-helix transcriptional regulator n=1 Tax=Gracilimonas sp. TaxID=1974203 RepID=UPI0032EC9578
MDGKYKEASECPITKSVDIIGGKWKPIILWVLRNGALRYNEINKEIEGVSEKVLSQQLTQLEKSGFVLRQVEYEKPPKVTYKLSDLGSSFVPVLETMADWSREKLS